MNFWQSLQKPIIGLSPMDGVSDAPFRYITAKYGKPDVIITEFISVDGITHGAERLFTDFLYSEIERPVAAQVFGIDPELFYISAQIVCELGFDGLDINMGCPAKSVSSRGSGAALIKTPKLAQQIMNASKQGVEDWYKNGLTDVKPKVKRVIENTKEKLQALGVTLPEDRRRIPVSVKTRIGFDEIVVEKWVETLLETNPANISVHGRTLKQLYGGSADWDAIARGAQIVQKFNTGKPASEQITYLGNGDITSPEFAVEIIKKSGVDGILIGRGSFGNPWIFKYKDQIKKLESKIKLEEVGIEQKIETAIEHSAAHENIKEDSPFVQMRKHLGWYFKGFPHAAKVRAELMTSDSLADVKRILSKID